VLLGYPTIFHKKKEMRVTPTTIQLIGAVFFAIAILHTFATVFFRTPGALTGLRMRVAMPAICGANTRTAQA